MVTEEYSDENVARWSGLFKRQYITTGIWNASSVEAYLQVIEPRLELINYGNGLVRLGWRPRILIVWIYWDVNDGSHELYRALTPTGLANPLALFAAKTVTKPTALTTLVPATVIAVIIVVAIIAILALRTRKTKAGAS